MEKLFGIVGVFAIVLGTILGLSFLMSWPVYMLWNGCLVGAIAGVNEVTWLQAWGITIMVGLLFKSSTTSSKKD
jgi:hypothetical protein